LINAHAQLELNRKNLVSLRQIAEVSRSRYEVARQTLPSRSRRGGGEQAARVGAGHLRNISSEQSQLNVLMNRDAFAPLASRKNANQISPHVDGAGACARTCQPSGD